MEIQLNPWSDILNICTDFFFNWTISGLFPTQRRTLHYFIIFGS